MGLTPLRRVAREVRGIELGEQAEIEGRYPTEITALTINLNTLITQERLRQTRYREALSFLAHSLKTPLAVLCNALGESALLPEAASQQVARMDDIAQHQLARAAAGSSSRFVPLLPIAGVVYRVEIHWPRCMPTRPCPFPSTSRPSSPGASMKAMPSRCSAT